MAKPIVLSSAACEDLGGIWHYIAIVNHNPDAAESLLRTIQETIALLPRFPARGVQCGGNFPQNVRRITVSGHSIYYRTINDTIEIARILDDRRDREETLRRWLTQR